MVILSLRCASSTVIALNRRIRGLQYLKESPVLVVLRKVEASQKQSATNSIQRQNHRRSQLKSKTATARAARLNTKRRNMSRTETPKTITRHQVRRLLNPTNRSQRKSRSFACFYDKGTSTVRTMSKFSLSQFVRSVWCLSNAFNPVSLIFEETYVGLRVVLQVIFVEILFCYVNQSNQFL